VLLRPVFTAFKGDKSMVQVQDRIETFVKQVNAMLETAFKTSRTKTFIEVVYTSDKWAKLLSATTVDGITERGHSAYGFICLKDFETKTLGVLKAGDIHKPASWQSPAKHARGNVFNDDCIRCAGPYGLSYLRG
jgi:hypothetical protein